MTREELQQRLQFIQDEQVTKNLSVFVTTKTTGLQLFNIREDDMGELLNMFIGSVKEKLIDDHTIVALTIMIAESNPEEKEMMISVVMNCMK